MAARKYTKAKVEHFRKEIATGVLGGVPQVVIAQSLGLAPNLVGYHLRVLRQRWREQSDRDIDDALSEQLAKLDAIESEAWESWRRSQQPIETTLRESAGTGRDMAMVRQVTTAGDPRFLEQVAKCIELRCKLLGLDAPRRHELAGLGGSPFGATINVYTPEPVV